MLRSIESNKNVDYYVDTFNSIIHHIKSLGNDFDILFNCESKKLLEKFINLQAIPKKLILRMYFRKSQVIKLNEIDHQENYSLEAEYINLLNSGLVDQLESLGQEHLWKLLKKKMIDTLIKEFHVSCRATNMQGKLQAIELHMNSNKTILSFFGGKSKTTSLHPIIKRAYSLIGPCYKLDKNFSKIFDTVFVYTDLSTDLNFQMMRTQTTISEIASSIIFNLSQILRGIILLPQFSFISVSFIEKFYIDKDSFNLHILNYHKLTKIIGSTNAKELKEISIFEDEFSEKLTYIIKECMNTNTYDFYHADIVRCCSKISDGLEVKRKYKNAVKILQILLSQKTYLTKYRGHWYNRLILIYWRRLNKPNDALKIVENSIKDVKVSEYHRYAIFKRCLKLLNKNSENPLFDKAKKFIDDIKSPPIFEIYAKRMNNKLDANHSKFEIIEYIDTENDVEKISTITSVEIYVMNYYKSNMKFSHGIFGEGSPFMTIFGLLLWDVIYENFDSVFFTPFQIKPADFFTKEFYHRRKDIIDDRIKLFKDEKYEEISEIIQKNWDKNFSVICPCVNWEIFASVEEVMSLIKCIKAVLIGIFHRFLENMSANRSGMPDLLLWNPETGLYRIVEVKGPGDKPSEKQIIWFHHLMQMKASIELCYVRDRRAD